MFINSAYPPECYEQMQVDSGGVMQIPSNVFQWSIIDGLEKNLVDFSLACVPALPAWPRYRHFFTPRGELILNGYQRGHYLRYFDFPAIKQADIKRVLYKYVKKWCEKSSRDEELCLLTYTQQADMLGAAIDIKRVFPNVKVATIVTDLIDNALDFKSNQRLLKRIQVELEKRAERTLFPNVDKYILLTSQMVECIPEAGGKFLVMEGVAPKVHILENRVVKNNEIRTLLYTGALEEYAGVRMLVDSFTKTRDNRFRLMICGTGSDASYIRDMATKDPRIVYRGRVKWDEAVRLQRESTLLINPRRPNNGITKYSFPSKTMEYMTSGTPMIGYHLEGIPNEYYNYMYTPVDLSVEALTDCIEKTLKLSQYELDAMALSAINYITQYKNSKVQVQRIVDFLSE